MGQDVEPIIFDVPVYSDELLNKTDAMVSGDVLVLANPTSATRYLNDLLANNTVAQLKHKMSHVDANFQNYLTRINQMVKRAPKVVSAILMYHEQIERQALETSRRDINLFTYMQEEKRELVRKDITDIIVWLLENTKEEFIWGDLSETQKKKFLSAVTRSFKPDIYLRENLIQMIADYTTMSEIEKGLTEGDTLKRFIVK